MKGVKLALYVSLSIIVILSLGASFYKYVVLSDYESLFYIACEEGESDCFYTLAYCEADMDPEECAYTYKVYAVKQNTLDNNCEVDEGECLEEICSDADQCKIIYCTSPNALNYELFDECAS